MEQEIRKLLTVSSSFVLGVIMKKTPKRSKKKAGKKERKDKTGNTNKHTKAERKDAIELLIIGIGSFKPPHT